MSMLEEDYSFCLRRFYSTCFDSLKLKIKVISMGMLEKGGMLYDQTRGQNL